MPNDQVTNLAIWRARLATWSSGFAAFLATRYARLTVITIFLIVALVLSFNRVWIPLRATVPLPPGVSERNPALNQELLQTINAQRVQRVDTPARPFNVGQLVQPARSTP